MTVVDLDALAYADVVEYKPKHPDPKVKTPLGTVKIAGPGHPQTLAAEEDERRRDLEELRDYKLAVQEAIELGQEVPRPPEEERTVADIRARNARRLASRIISADFSVSLDGKTVELSRDTAADILSNPRIAWLYEGLAAFLQKRANFIVNSANGL